MRKSVLYLVVCVLMIACALWAYENYLDFLAGGLVCLAVIPSCLYNKARKERKGE